MTPHEAIFSRRGSVKLVLMELEQLRETLALLQPTLTGAARCHPSQPASVPEAPAACSADTCKSSGGEANPGISTSRAYLPQSAAEKATDADSRARSLKGRPRPHRTDAAQRPQPGQAPSRPPRGTSGGDQQLQLAGSARQSAVGDSVVRGVLLLDTRSAPASAERAESRAPAQRPVLVSALAAG
jgi:hypothetical protein